MKKAPDDIAVREVDGITRIWYNPYQREFVRDYYSDRGDSEEHALPLRVDFVLEEHCFEKYYRRRENSEVFSIEMVIEGEMYFCQDGKDYLVNPGEVFLVHRERDNEFSTGPSGHCKRLACSLSGGALNALLHSCGLIERNMIRPVNTEKLEKLIRGSMTELKNKGTGFRVRASLLAYELLLELAAEFQSGGHSGLIARARELMEHHLSQRLSLRRLASLLGVSPTTLHREFQEHLKTSPILYFINLKMSAASSMLLNTNMPIKEIAVRLGYENPLYFSAEFRKRCGLSPRGYRESKGRAGAAQERGS